MAEPPLADRFLSAVSWRQVFRLLQYQSCKSPSPGEFFQIYRRIQPNADPTRALVQARRAASFAAAHRRRDSDEPALARVGTNGTGRRSESGAAGPGPGNLSRRHQRPYSAHVRACDMRAGPVVWFTHLFAASETPGAPLHARDLGTDLRDLQNLSDNSRQISVDPGSLHRSRHGALLRRIAAHGSDQGDH